MEGLSVEELERLIQMEIGQLEKIDGKGKREDGVSKDGKNGNAGNEKFGVKNGRSGRDGKNNSYSNKYKRKAEAVPQKVVIDDILQVNADDSHVEQSSNDIECSPLKVELEDDDDGLLSVLNQSGEMNKSTSAISKKSVSDKNGKSLVISRQNSKYRFGKPQTPELTPRCSTSSVSVSVQSNIQKPKEHPKPTQTKGKKDSKLASTTSNQSKPTKANSTTTANHNNTSTQDTMKQTSKSISSPQQVLSGVLTGLAINSFTKTEVAKEEEQLPSFFDPESTSQFCLGQQGNSSKQREGSCGGQNKKNFLERNKQCAGKVEKRVAQKETKPLPIIKLKEFETVTPRYLDIKKPEQNDSQNNRSKSRGNSKAPSIPHTVKYGSEAFIQAGNDKKSIQGVENSLDDRRRSYESKGQVNSIEEATVEETRAQHKQRLPNLPPPGAFSSLHNSITQPMHPLSNSHLPKPPKPLTTSVKHLLPPTQAPKGTTLQNPFRPNPNHTTHHHRSSNYLNHSLNSLEDEDATPRSISPRPLASNKAGGSGDWVQRMGVVESGKENVDFSNLPSRNNARAVGGEWSKHVFESDVERGFGAKEGLRRSYAQRESRDGDSSEHKQYDSNSNSHSNLQKTTQPRLKKQPVPLQEEPTYKPMLNKKSLDIAKKLDKSIDRLVASELSQPQNEQPIPQPANSFQPKICSKSRDLDRRKSPIESVARHDRLINIGEEYNLRVKRMQREKERELEDEFLGLDFKPLIPPRAVSPHLAVAATAGVADRNEKWVQRKQERLNKLKEDIDSQNAQQCTFQPQMVSKAPDQSILATNKDMNSSVLVTAGVENYFTRLEQARRIKREKMAKLDPFGYREMVKREESNNNKETMNTSQLRNSGLERNKSQLNKSGLHNGSISAIEYDNGYDENDRSHMSIVSGIDNTHDIIKHNSYNSRGNSYMREDPSEGQVNNSYLGQHHSYTSHNQHTEFTKMQREPFGQITNKPYSSFHLNKNGGFDSKLHDEENEFEASSPDVQKTLQIMKNNLKRIQLHMN